MSLVNAQIRQLAERIARSHGLEIVDLESQGGGGKHRTLRVFLERDAAGRAVLRERLAAVRGDSGVERAPAGYEAGLLGETDELDEVDETDETELDETGPDETGLDELGELDASEENEEDGDVEEADGIVLDLVEAGEVAGLTPEEDELAYLREMPTGVPVEQMSGVTHGDCERFSRDFGTALDMEEIVPGAEYLLEVSSPGLDRVLRGREDFERFAGLLCKVQTFTAVEGNRHWQGHLGGVFGESVRLVLPVKKATGKKKKDAAAVGTTVEIALENVEKARLVPEFLTTRGGAGV